MSTPLPGFEDFEGLRAPKVLVNRVSPEAVEVRTALAERSIPANPETATPPQPTRALPVTTAGEKSPPAPSTSPAG